MKDTKVCPHCMQSKLLGEFHKNKSRQDGVHSWCKKCVLADARARYLADPQKYLSRSREWGHNNPDKKRTTFMKWRYNISPDDFLKLLEIQDGRCGICKTTNPGKTGWRIDHDHVSNSVRGILCHKCNTSLGGLGDDIEGLERALSYLKVYSDRKTLFRS